MEYITLKQLCEELSISLATGKNWLKLGKIRPKESSDGNAFFTKNYVDELKKEIKSGKNAALKSRRNKKYVSGNGLYNSYVSKDCKALLPMQKLLSLAQECEIALTNEIICLFVADCALHFMADRFDKKSYEERGLLVKFLEGKVSFGERDKLILPLIPDRQLAIDFAAEFPILFDLGFYYEDKEDVLGLIYISCKNIGNRKATGAYFTPNRIVKKMIAGLSFNECSTIVDPCCGTGNFLLQLPDRILLDQIYGNDTDDISVKIARINLALRYKDADVDTICKHVVEKDYLAEDSSERYDVIFGNPPWGYEFLPEEKLSLKGRYQSAKGTNIESYNVFIEKALLDLKPNGTLAYVLPQAILGVKTHAVIRDIIIKKGSISRIDYLGDAFDKVQCPCIIMQIRRTDEPFSAVGMKIDDGEKTFVIEKERKVTADGFSFAMTDQEYSVLEKLYSGEGVRFLLGNADFALGIVTGNNKEFISEVKTSDNEMVLKGSDISRFHINDSGNYITFAPEKFQQVAPTTMYRAGEKLFYRFISNQLVFAYDDKGTLSLNSCNIVIPRLPGVDIKFVLAILNSRAAQFIYKKKFDSVKVLRAHIEDIPIPFADENQQKKVISLVDKLIAGDSLAEYAGLSEDEKAAKQALIYDELDARICDLFGLTQEERAVL